MNLTQLKQLQKQGKIQNFTVHKREQTFKDSDTKPRKDLPTIPNAAKRSDEKDWLHWNLIYWANENSLKIIEEFRFDDERRFRFDWYLPALKLGIEYNGGMFRDKGCHNTAGQLSRDYTKNNLAIIRGYKLLSYNCITYKNIIRDLKEILK